METLRPCGVRPSLLERFFAQYEFTCALVGNGGLMVVPLVVVAMLVEIDGNDSSDIH